MTVKTLIQYGPAPLQTGDLYQPDTSNGAAILFIHGGAFIRGDKAVGEKAARYLSDLGFLVLAINYRLAPEDLFPAAQRDLESAIVYMQSRFDGYKLGLLGASVGGTMALTSASRHHFPAVSWSAIVQTKDWVQAHPDVQPALDAKTLGVSDPETINEAFYGYFIQTYLGKVTDQKLDQLDPLARLAPVPGPILMFNSTDELAPLKDAVTFVKRLAPLQKDSRLTVFAGDQHAMGYEAKALGQTAHFFETHLLKAPK